MTQKELAERLAGTRLPVAYRAFRTRQAPPYICYLYAYDTKFFADDAMYFSAGHYQVELYTSVKSPDMESVVEDALTGLNWEKTEEYSNHPPLWSDRLRWYAGLDNRCADGGLGEVCSNWAGECESGADPPS